MSLFQHRFVPVLALVVLSLAVYANSFPGAFLWDDLEIVRDNPLVQSFEVKEIFTTGYWWQGSDPDGLYRPLTILSFAANRALFGPGPLSFHLANVLLHAAVGAAFYLALRILGFRIHTAWFAAALFAVHPIHTEAVNLAVGRSELLVALFLFLGIAAAVRPSPAHLPAVTLCYAAALFSKEHAVTFPAFLFIADAFRADSPAETVRKRLPLYLLLGSVAGLFLLVSRMTVWRAPAGVSFLHPADNPLVGLDLVPRIATALKVQLVYLGKLLLPLHLQVSYGRSSMTTVEGIATAWGALSLGAVIALALLTIHGWRRREGYALGILFYACGAVVTANLFFPVAMMIAERFTYLSSAGFCLALASAAEILSSRLSGSKTRTALHLLAVSYLLFLGGVTAARNPDFRDSLRLWESTVKADPENPFAWQFLANAREMRGQDREAEEAYLTSLGIDSTILEVNLTYGSFLLSRDRPGEAVPYLERSVRLRGNETGTPALLLAQAYLQLGQPNTALDWLEKTGPSHGRDFTFWDVRGRVLEALQDLEESAASFRNVLAIRPDPDASLRLGRLLIRLGRPGEAEPVLRLSLSRKENAEGHDVLGISLALQGKTGEAREEFRKAAALDPANEKYRRHLDKASRGVDWKYPSTLRPPPP